jgi:hypothetical protein
VSRLKKDKESFRMMKKDVDSGLCVGILGDIDGARGQPDDANHHRPQERRQ